MAENEEKIWSEIHKKGYGEVYTMTEDEALRERIADEIAPFVSNDDPLLILGCGSRGILERSLSLRFPDLRIVANDFQAVIDIVRPINAAYPQIEYVAVNSHDIGQTYKERFNAAVIVNSILSPSLEENERLLSSCAQALKPGGRLVGFFPTINCTRDWIKVSGNEHLSSCIDAKASTFTDPVTNQVQAFATPLELYRQFKQAGLNIKVMENYFLDTEHFFDEAKRLYEAERDHVLYEHLVIAEKPESLF